MNARIFQTEFGWMAAVATAQGISNILLPVDNKRKIEKNVLSLLIDSSNLDQSYEMLDKLQLDMERYFSGKKVDFSSYPLDLSAATPFQRRIWSFVRKISYGKTVTYSYLANKLNTGARAVGMALHANPIPILIPCHRVISSNGLGGFSSGISLKEKMLKLEGAI